MSQSVGYILDVQGWPVSTEPDDLTTEDIYELLEDDEFSIAHERALEGLAHAKAPTEEGKTNK